MAIGMEFFLDQAFQTAKVIIKTTVVNIWPVRNIEQAKTG
jgi:hypothetical protein